MTMRMLFEVQDLAVASPATVSRCGMVYVPPEELGWKPYIQTWTCQGLPEDTRQENRDFVLKLFSDYVEQGLKFIRKQVRYIDSRCKLFKAHLGRYIGREWQLQ